MAHPTSDSSQVRADSISVHRKVWLLMCVLLGGADGAGDEYVATVGKKDRAVMLWKVTPLTANPDKPAPDASATKKE
jgi:hypothetical protein